VSATHSQDDVNVCRTTFKGNTIFSL